MLSGCRRGRGVGGGGGKDECAKFLPHVKSDSRLCSQTRCVTVAWHKAIYALQPSDKDIQKRDVEFFAAENIHYTTE
jgi:hypothetical protein